MWANWVSQAENEHVKEAEIQECLLKTHEYCSAAEELSQSGFALRSQVCPICIRAGQTFAIALAVCRLCHIGPVGMTRQSLLEFTAGFDVRAHILVPISEWSGVMAKLSWARGQPLVNSCIIACLHSIRPMTYQCCLKEKQEACLLC